jgi:glucose-1-phosphatase
LRRRKRGRRTGTQPSNPDETRQALLNRPLAGPAAVFIGKSLCYVTLCERVLTVNLGLSMAIRTLLLDLGNVLVYFSHERMCAQIAGAFGVPEARVRNLILGTSLQSRFERGQISESAFQQELEQALGRRIQLSALESAVADIFELNEAMVPLLDRWKRDGYRLVLLSNTCVSHYRWIRERFNVLEGFDACVLSFEVGSVKPEDAIFHSALQAIECAPGECFYTDDIATYVEKGRSHRLQAEIFTDAATLARHLESRGVACSDQFEAVRRPDPRPRTPRADRLL